MKHIKRILHATDFSPASEPALEDAIDLAKQNDAELLVVHVIEPVRYVAGEEFGGPELYVKLEEITDQNAQASMKKLIEKVESLKVKAKSLLLKGIAHEQIVNAAENAKADMIVIGTHGRTGFSKLFMGSVAGRIISTALCPVLTVRGKAS
ncbi:MAG: universal stress protein [Alphaproteobacteria bacterium]